MDVKKILAAVDHTNLSPTATENDIRKLIEEAIMFSTATVCIAPAFVPLAATVGGVKICTVIGFPNGGNTTAVKCFEARDAVRNGADEIDMVINLSDAKSGKWDRICDEIASVKDKIGDKTLKVIVETCLLTQGEKIAACRAVSLAGADFIKTSTGFSTGGATLADVLLFKENVAPAVRIKAAGGIRGLADAEAFLNAGADRVGTSRVVKAVIDLIERGELKWH